MKRIKLTEAQLKMIQLNEARIDIERAIEPEVNEISNTLAGIAKQLKTMTAPRAIMNPNVLSDMVAVLEPLDDRIYDLSNKVDDFNENPQYTNIDRYIVKSLNDLEFKQRELFRIASSLSRLADKSNFMKKPEIFDGLFK